jgi:hypothetical protein
LSLALLEFQAAGNDAGARWRSPLSITLVLLLHAIFLALLLTPFPRAIMRAVPRETILFFPRPEPLPEKPLPRRVIRSLTAPAFQYDVAPPDIRVAPPGQLGLSLFGCSPENLGNLTAEERAHCDGAFVAGMRAMANGPMKEHALHATRWAAVIHARNTAVRIPCTYITTTPGATPNTAITLPMAQPLCVLQQIEDGIQQHR